MPPVTRVVIAEDHLLLRDGLIRLLSANGLEVAASVDNAAGLLDIVDEQEPDIAVIDVRLPPHLHR
jgi:DNA-binding NarL/FixJ family response regulator